MDKTMTVIGQSLDRFVKFC